MSYSKIDQPEIFHDPSNDVVAFSVDFQRRGVVFGRPLEVDDNYSGPLPLLPFHVPEARVLPEDFETGPDAEDEVRLTSEAGGGRPMVRRNRVRWSLLSEMDDSVFKLRSAVCAKVFCGKIVRNNGISTVKIF